MKKVLVDLVGKRFGSLVVKSRGGPNRFGGAVWLCACDCGVEKVVAAKYLKSGQTKSCGCMKPGLIRALKTKHGGRLLPEYKTWMAIKARCFRLTHQDYPDYGGRGITVCERWRSSFRDFLADVGRKPSPDHSIDRHPDVNGNYEPGNVRWANTFQQANNRRSNRYLDFRGQRKTVAEWSRELGHDNRNVRDRIDRYGWSVDRALTHYTPAQCRRCDG